VTITFPLNEFQQYEVEIWAGVSSKREYRRELIWQSAPSTKNQLSSLSIKINEKAIAAVVTTENWLGDSLPCRYCDLPSSHCICSEYLPDHLTANN